uniref:Uncharacterized protein n=1 Tax=Erpetoichthys calabaricus TaxID=27687 RepID=A0A8C4RXY5_ERPCA
MRVIFESLYGTCWLLRLGSPRALITFPNANNPLLICTDSLNRSPVLPVLVTLSEPARSTKWNFEEMILLAPSRFNTSALPPSRSCITSSALSTSTMSLAKPNTTLI